MDTTAASAAEPQAAGPWQRPLTNNRQAIDHLDQQILELLNQRAACALDIARVKGVGSQPSFAPEREAQILRALLEAHRGPLPDQSLRRIFSEIISACRGLQKPLRVAYLGPEATFSHQAALQHFGSACDFAAQTTIIDVFEEVERGHAQVAVVPVENSTEGAVGVTLDQFQLSELKVCGEIYSLIRQMLLSRRTEINGVERVYGHPQSLNQCRRWLRRNLPQAALVESSSTAAAARQAAEDDDSASLGGRITAEHYGLGILASDIQDVPRNLTRFFVLGHEDCPPTGHDKTSLIFQAAHQPGSLYKALGHFAERGINMTRIESRPVKGQPWEYAFFLDCQGHREDEPVASAIAALSRETEQIKVLGSYPAGDPESAD